MKVTLKGAIPAGVDLATHLHYMKAKGAYGGFLAWHPNRPAKAGQPTVFNFKPAAKEGMTAIDAIDFLAPGGEFGKQVKDVHLSIPWDAPIDFAGISALSVGFCSRETVNTLEVGDLILVGPR